MTRRFAFLLPLLIIACQDLPEPTLPADDTGAALGSLERSPHAPQDLAVWFARSSPEVLALPQTVFADHDEAGNRLVFGVEHEGMIRRVQNVMAALNIPASAYHVKVTEPIHLMSDNLRSEHRPTVGGVQIHWSQYVCTLGFNVDHEGGRSFITNSHCTDKRGENTGTVYHQPTRTAAPDAIGVEADDPAFFRGGICPRGRVCRYSDAARALYGSDTDSNRGEIAKTTGENNGDLAVVEESFTITSQENSSTNFSGTVHKVGRTTGWTSGTVTNTCATVNVSGSNVTMLCETLVQRSGSRIVQGGDSGSPVFTRSSGDNVELIGILWGGSSSGDLFVFSPLKNIQDELGGVTATASGDGGGNGNGTGDENGDDDNGGGNCPPGNPNHRNCP